MTWPGFALLLTISLFPGALPQGQPTDSPAAMQTWHAWVEICCDFYDVDKRFVIPVFKVESGVPGGPSLRFGRLGKTCYFGPGGVNENCECLRGLDLANPYISTWASIRALQGVGSDLGKLKKRLRNYNRDPDKRAWERYWRAIRQCVEAQEREIRRKDD